MKEYKKHMQKIRLVKERSEFKMVKVTTSSAAADVIREFYFEDLEIFESFFILLLNRANNTIGYAKISQGGISGTVVDLRIIAKYCIESFASGVILAHNHPSGNIQPSNADIDMTKKIQDVLNLFECKVIDHIILTESDYYSFADEGVL